VIRTAGVLSVALAVNLLTLRARAADDEIWQPRTAGHVKGEIDRPFDDETIDGVYDRLDGPFTLGLGAGMEQASSATRGAARLTLHYYWSAGIYAGYSRAFSGAAPADVLGAGIDFRPAFLPRWAKNMEQGPAVLDLCVDSISLGLGAFWQTPDAGSFGSRRGFEASLGFGVPLFGSASGLWLSARGSLRWPDGSDADPAALVLLEYDQVLGSGAGSLSGLSPD
jgi:hypothetical protein